MITTKVFKSGNSQAIRLPKNFRLDVDSVKINKIGNLLIIISDDDPWFNFIEGINKAEEFPTVENRELSLREVMI